MGKIDSAQNIAVKAASALQEAGKTAMIALGKFPHKTKAAQVAALVLGLSSGASYCSRPDLDEFEFPHQGESFKLEDLTLREKVAQLMHGSLYDSRFSDLVDRAANRRDQPLPEGVSDWVTDGLKSDENLGGIHIFRSDARSLDETRRTIREQMVKSKIPPFISMDIVGGYTRHLGITQEEAKSYGVPENFLKMAQDHNIELPAQEDLGRAFEALNSEKDRVAFRIQMEAYGKAVAKLCRDLGISVNFGPVMDIVGNKDGDSFMEKNDEAYSDKLRTVMILSFHFIKGFQTESGVMIVPKHFAGTGKLEVNPHEDTTQTPSKITTTDGSFLPFLDAAKGTLFTDPIDTYYRFDQFLRNARSDSDKKSLAAMLSRNNIPVDSVGVDFTVTRPVGGMMVGHASTFMDKDRVPGALSEKTVTDYLRGSLGFNGITWTDDLGMGAIQSYAAGSGCHYRLDSTGDIVAQALIAGVTMPMILHRGGELNEIANTLEQRIKDKVDSDKDGRADLTMKMIDERVRKILEEKVRLGLLKKEQKEGQVVYTNNSKEYLKIN